MHHGQRRSGQLQFDDIVKPDPSRLPLVEKAKAIRAILKERFPGQKFSVKSDRFSMGESIDISWTDGVANNKVEELVAPFERIDRDEVTGEILSGGNSYVQCRREISPEAMEKVKKKVKDRFVEGTFGDWDQDLKFRDFVWREIRETDL